MRSLAAIFVAAAVGTSCATSDATGTRNSHFLLGLRTSSVEHTNPNVSLQRQQRISLLTNIRGGASRSVPEDGDNDETVAASELQWSWDENARKGAPLKMVLGVAAFAAAAFPRTQQPVEPVNSRKNLMFWKRPTLALPPPPLRGPGSERGQATIPELTFNLVKAILGAGVLALPSGIAAFGNAKSAIIPAVILVVVMGTLSAVGFAWIAKVCAMTGAQSYQEAWSLSVSRKTSWLPTVCSVLKTFSACLSFSIVLSDSLRAFVPIQSRALMLWSVTGLLLLPLCWEKDLKSLVPTSFLGVFGMVFTTACMMFRYVHGSYQAGSPLLRDIPEKLQPAFGNDGWQAVFRPASVHFVCMLSTAFTCHFNSPRFHRELKENTLPRFNRLVAIAFGIGIVLASLVAAIGFATFGSASDSFILSNYAPDDFWIHLSKAAVASSLLSSYPILFQGLRDGVMDMLSVPVSKRSNKILNYATISILLVVTILATFIADVSSLITVGGVVLSNLLIYIFPSFMLACVDQNARIPAAVLGSAGIIIGLIGTALTLRTGTGAR